MTMSRFARLVGEFSKRMESHAAAEGTRLRRHNPKLKLIGTAIGIVVVILLALWMWR
jgi:hypothetical protein